MGRNQLEKAKALLEKFHNGTISSEEELLLLRWLNQYQAADSSGLTDEALEQASVELKDRLDDYVVRTRPRSLVKLAYWSAACIALVCFGLGFYFLAPKGESSPSGILYDHEPGQQKATLVLEDGRELELLDEQGDLVHRDGYAIRQTADSGLIYQLDFHANREYLLKASGKIPVNTLIIPRGGQFQLTLPDGTLVWLNSESRITYPVRFGDVREVTLVGEAYFKVKRDEERPFKVHAGLQLIEVLGTEFNVNAYPDQQKTQTVLVSGAVKVASATYPGAVSRELKPGQMAEMYMSSALSSGNINVAKYTAWRHGDFYFEDESLPEIMDVLSRWYDVKVVYADNFKNKGKFGGVISRNKKLSAVIQMLESTGNVKFEITDKEVLLMN